MPCCREEELPVVRVIVPPDPSGPVFEDDPDPGDLVFDGKRTPMLVWHERYPVGHPGWLAVVTTVCTCREQGRVRRGTSPRPGLISLIASRAYRQPSAGATWVRMVSMTWAL
jgi:hypothetical protein